MENTVENEEEIPAEMNVVDAEEVYPMEEEETFNYAYDSAFNYSSEKNLIFDLYQPQETPEGTYLCRICLRGGKTMEYTDRNAFVAHRYKCHGSFNNNVLCPFTTCREVFASMTTLRRHLAQTHEQPLEVHQQAFANIGEFEKFRHVVEAASGCRFMMHTKQPKLRRQVMHCSRSEHKLVLQTHKHRLPRLKMEKEGACCPAHISFRVDGKTGEVHCFCQLFHIGHAPGEEEPTTSENPNQARPVEIHFPPKPKFYGDTPMQFLQIDVYEMQAAVYGPNMYENILVITDSKTNFMWARALTDVTRTVITRILTAIFTEFGLPEGFSTTYSPTYIRDSMKAIESIYAKEIREIWNEPPLYDELEQWLMMSADVDLGSTNRWVEQVQFVVMEKNQKSIDNAITPFERMFKRKPPQLYETDAERLEKIHNPPQNTVDSDDEEGGNIRSIMYHAGEQVFLRKHTTKPSRGNNILHYYGYISEVDKTNKHYPYKVHYSSNDTPWPTEANQFTWSSQFDILPTTHRIREISKEEREKFSKTMFCICSGQTSRAKYDFSLMPESVKDWADCLLFRNILCDNKMSKMCCKIEGTQPCRYHACYPETDDSYTKLEISLVNFNKLKYQEKLAEEAAKAIEESEEKEREERMRLYAEEEQEYAKVQEYEKQQETYEIPKKKRLAAADQPSTSTEGTPSKQRKIRGEKRSVSPTPSEVSIRSSTSPTRRISGRKTTRPKNFDDFVA